MSPTGPTCTDVPGGSSKNNLSSGLWLRFPLSADEMSGVFLGQTLAL